MISSGKSALSLLSAYHPLVIEGATGRHDKRDASVVAALLCTSLREHWRQKPPDGPTILMIQGDPYEPTGISAVTRHVASELRIPRCLVALDAAIDSEHQDIADKEGGTMELRG